MVKCQWKGMSKKNLLSCHEKLIGKANKPGGPRVEITAFLIPVLPRWEIIFTLGSDFQGGGPIQIHLGPYLLCLSEDGSDAAFCLDRQSPSVAPKGPPHSPSS
jgi:hypothetical protein